MDMKLKVGEYWIRVTRFHVVREDSQSIWSETSTVVEIDDEACGEFVVVRQQLDVKKPTEQQVAIDPDEWAAIKVAVDLLQAECGNKD